MPQASLYHIPLVLPEVVLATKEFNEKARSEAFDCLVSMGEKIKGGGSLKPTADLEKMDEDEASGKTAAVTLACPSDPSTSRGSYHRNVHQACSDWNGWEIATYDQCRGDSSVENPFRVQRYGSRCLQWFED